MVWSTIYIPSICILGQKSGCHVHVGCGEEPLCPGKFVSWRKYFLSLAKSIECYSERVHITTLHSNKISSIHRRTLCTRADATSPQEKRSTFCSGFFHPRGDTPSQPINTKPLQTYSCCIQHSWHSVVEVDTIWKMCMQYAKPFPSKLMSESE